MSGQAFAGSVASALGAAADAFAAAGIDTPRLDAELLLERATGTPRARLIANPEAGVEAAAARDFGAMVRRRIQREPIAYILGAKGFRRLDLAVDPRVLIPRPETELLVELALELEPLSVLDVGTGSGAVALAIADELPAADVVATDTSLDALAVAQANRDRLGLADRVRLADGSLDPGSFDLIVANLPYVSEDEWSSLAREIREYEPREALVSGPTGLEAIEGLLAAIAAAPEPPTAIGLELGIDQGLTVAELTRRAGFDRIEIRPDLAGNDRVVVAWR